MVLLGRAEGSGGAAARVPVSSALPTASTETPGGRQLLTHYLRRSQPDGLPGQRVLISLHLGTAHLYHAWGTFQTLKSPLKGTKNVALTGL